MADCLWWTCGIGMTQAMRAKTLVSWQPST